MDRSTALAEVAQDLRAVSLYQDANFVPGEGSPNAQVMFVGEAPGQKEDASGRPFVGAAGRFLTEMLELISLKRGDVFITNIVKQRPPDNRDPLPAEIAAHWPFLERQIAIIEPRIIVMLGRHSMARLLPGVGPISQVHGRPYRRQDGRVYLPLYHPAVALYNGSMRHVLMADFQKIPPILKKISPADSTGLA